MTESAQFVCVLRTGGVYTHRYVNNIYTMLANAMRTPFTLTCLTDNGASFHPNIRVVAMQHVWPGWWSKIELFRYGIWESGRVWYIDLDTLIVGDLTSMVITDLGSSFYALADFMDGNRTASGVMSWMANDPAMHAIYSQFIEKQNQVITSCSTLGDQCWIGIAGPAAKHLQTAFPRQFASFKLNCTAGTQHPTAKVICFHGHPRPHEAIRDPLFGWVRSYWK